MKLKEWKDSNGNKVNISPSPAVSSTSSKTSSGSFKKRLNKLINYYGQHLPADVGLKVNLLIDDALEFTEYYNNSNFDIVEFKIYIGPTTEAWSLKVFTNNKLTDDLSGMSWTELLKNLRAFITIPVTTTPEYKDLLTEWVDKNGKKVSFNTSSIADDFKTYETLWD